MIEGLTADLLQGNLAIERMCALAGVNRSGFYRAWQASAPRVAATALRDAIQRIALMDRNYGYRRIGEELRRQGWVVNHKRVLRLTNMDNLLCLRRKPFVPRTTDSAHTWTVVPNLARGMILSALDQLWVADITYIRMKEGVAYLAVVLDAFSRKVVGWAIAEHLQASLAIEALVMAIDARKPPTHSLIHHSDRGVQYACRDYAALLETHAIRASMSRVGNPYDNAKAESFMKTLKTEEVDGRAYRNLADAKRQIVAFIDKIYNHRRLHSAIGYRPPAEFEANWISPHTAAAQQRRAAGVLPVPI